MKTKEKYLHILSDFQKGRGSYYGITHLGIFGSVARDEHTTSSDIDICYEGDSISLFKLAELKEELETLLGCQVDIVRIRETMNQILKKRITKESIYV